MLLVIQRRRRFAMNVHHGFQRTLFSPSSSSLTPLELPSLMETHFWYVLPNQVTCPNLLTRYEDLLSPCERDRLCDIRNHEARKIALISRALVRTTVSRYINSAVHPASLKFRKNNFGKPEVDWEIGDQQLPPLHFNISHTSSFIACGVTINAQIGIDVEDKARKTKSHVLALARRYFSSHEVQHLSSISDPEIQRQEFMKLWTLKEAYVKALGRGFSAAPFSTFTIRLGSTVPGEESKLSGEIDSKESKIMIERTDDLNILTSDWQFALLELAGSHYAAICTEKDKLAKAKSAGGSGNLSKKLTVRRTIPFFEDECINELRFL